MTVMWFASWQAVKGFAGDDHEAAYVPARACGPETVRRAVAALRGSGAARQRAAFKLMRDRPPSWSVRDGM